jgi:hypothetical protein
VAALVEVHSFNNEERLFKNNATMMGTVLVAVGFLALAVTYHSTQQPRRDRTFVALLALGIGALLLRSATALWGAVEAQWAHSRSLAAAAESQFTIQTFLLTQRGLARLLATSSSNIDADGDADASDAVAMDTSQSRELSVPELLADSRFGAIAALLPARDSFLRQKHFGRCAVVGNSGVSLGLGLGEDIDAHDLVVRFNYPPLAGFERDVGNRTDWMLTGASTLFKSNHHPFLQYSDYPADMSLLLFPRSAATLLERRAELLRADVAPRLRFVSPFFTDLVQRLFVEYVRQLGDSSRANDKGHTHRPSSGLRGIVVALLACNHTDVYGFGASRDFGHGHYYSQAGAGVQVENAGHNYTLERRFLLDVASGAAPCARFKSLAGLACGSLRVETRNAVPLAELLDGDDAVARLQSAAAAERVREWQERKASRVKEREVRKEAQANGRREQTNCAMVRRPSGDVWRCHFFSKDPPSAFSRRELKEREEAAERNETFRRMGLQV